MQSGASAHANIYARFQKVASIASSYGQGHLLHCSSVATKSQTLPEHCEGVGDIGYNSHLRALCVCSCEVSQQLPGAGIQVTAIVRPLCSRVILSPVHRKHSDPRGVQLVLKQSPPDLMSSHTQSSEWAIAVGQGRSLSLVSRAHQQTHLHLDDKLSESARPRALGALVCSQLRMQYRGLYMWLARIPGSGGSCLSS